MDSTTGGPGYATQEDLVAFYDARVQEVYGYLLRRCGSVSLAEDLTQEVFVGAAKHFRHNAQLPAPGWLFHSARSRLIDHWRRRARAKRKLRLVGQARGDEREKDHADRVASAQLLSESLSRLPEHYQAVLILRYFDDLPVDRIAVSLGKSVRATESLLVRARRHLESELRGLPGD